MADPWILKSLTMITEDKHGDAILLCLHNQVDEMTTKIKEVQEQFPIGKWIAIKHPYMKLSYSGDRLIRNDDPKNLITK